MANTIDRQLDLFALLDEVAIPYAGITIQDINANPVQATLQYLPQATAEQIALGDQILAAFDWRRRRALPRGTVVTALGQLTTNQQNAVIRHMVCDYLRQNPRIMTQINAALGTSLTVDEVDPT